MSESNELKTTTISPNQEALPPLTPQEQEILSALERSRGRSLTDQEKFLALEQARALGEV